MLYYSSHEGRTAIYLAKAPLGLVILLASYALAADTAVIGVKLLKAVRGDTAGLGRVQLPAGCELMHGAIYEGSNGREAFFYIKAPLTQRLLPRVKVELGGLKVRGVIVEKRSIPFTLEEGAAVFDVPVAARARSSTLELQTSLSWPGIVLRIEHAFEDRRAGRYATGRWPAVERSAALNLEFGVREALRTMGIDRKLAEEKLGTVHLMGFDTNNPLGHEDYPPHMHIILRWPNYAGSQAPHFYIDGAGVIASTTITIDGMPFLKATEVGRGVAIPVVDYLGHTLFSEKVTAAGWLELALPGGGACLLRPVEAAAKGFADGVSLRCGNDAEVTVKAEDDTEAGEVRAHISGPGGDRSEIHRYDVDTGSMRTSKEPSRGN